MTSSALFVITSDPRTSARPAEAIRIAAGVGAWKKVAITLYLRGAAVLGLGEDPDDLFDEDNYTRYLPMVGELGRPVYVQQGAPWLGELGVASLPYEELDDDGLAALAARHDCVLRF